MNIQQLVEEAHNTAKEKGWYDPGTEKTSLEAHMLIVSEIAEATEEARKGNPSIYYVDKRGSKVAHHMDEGALLKPEGELIELADAIIRIADYCGFRGWDLEEAIEAKLAYNATRPHRHGGKLK